MARTSSFGESFAFAGIEIGADEVGAGAGGGVNRDGKDGRVVAA